MGKAVRQELTASPEHDDKLLFTTFNKKNMLCGKFKINKLYIINMR